MADKDKKSESWWERYSSSRHTSPSSSEKRDRDSLYSSRWGSYRGGYDWDDDRYGGSPYWGSGSYYSSRSSYYDDYYSRPSRSTFVPRRESMSSFISTSYGDIDTGKDVDKRRAELFDKSLKLTREFISILNLPFQVYIKLDDSIEEVVNINNARRLFIPTKIFDKIEGKKDEEIINTVVGLGLHEAAHLKFTEYSVADRISSSRGLKSLFFNILEDERVDNLLLLERPGYREFIKSEKQYSISQNIKVASSHKDCERVITNILYLIRDPEKVEEDIVKANKDFFDEVIKILEIKSSRSLDIINKAGKLEELVKNKFSSKITLEEIDQVSSRFWRLYTKLLYGYDQDSRLSLPSVAIADSLNSSSATSFSTEVKISLGMIERGEEINSFFIKGKTENHYKDKYFRIKESIVKFVPQIRKKLLSIEKNEDFNIYGCRSGLLDTSKLVEAYQSVPQVYIRQGTISTNKINVCVLIDESGSMHSSGKYRLARKAAILLREALVGIPGINLYIYGHTADQLLGYRESLDVSVYVEPGKESSKEDYLLLAGISAKNENRDGSAILEVAKRIRKKTQDKCLMFVISDGVPAAMSYWGMPAILDTQKKVVKAEALGFDIIQITIDGNISDTKKMFSKYIDLRDNISELPEKLGNVIKTFIVENKTSTISS